MRVTCGRLILQRIARRCGRQRDRNVGRRWVKPGAVRVFIDEDAFARPLQILILTVTQRPEEGGQSDRAETQGDWHKEDETGHWARAQFCRAAWLPRAAALRAGRRRVPAFRRSAFATTMIDEEDMAKAAMSGVTWPSMAIGKAIAL